jgi:hypothetical protein
MNLHRTLLAGPMVLALASATLAAPSDVRPNHWAYSSIQRLAEKNLLGRWAGTFDGKRMVSRAEAAQIIARLLDAAGSGGGAFTPSDIRELNNLADEFGADLDAAGARVAQVEEQELAIRDTLAALKRGTFSGGTSKGKKGIHFSGYLATSLTSTDDGTATLAPAGGLTPVRTRYTGTTADQTFFTLPQASMAVDAFVGEGWGFHMQLDYTTDTINAIGTGVGLNEAYLTKEGFGRGGVDLKLGGFALPFQSWEFNGPFRTPKKTITPSAIGTFFEAFRPIGFELEGPLPSEVDLEWRLGIFNGADTAVGAGFTVGAMNDGVGLGALGGSTTNDNTYGLYVELEGKFGDDNGGYRFGSFDNGGDHGVGITATNSQELNGLVGGLWYDFGFTHATFQMVDLESDPGTGPTNVNEISSWYLMLDFEINDDSAFVLRYDDWTNDVQVPPGALAGTNGDAFTLAFRRELSPTSDIKFEALFVDEAGRGAPATSARDIDDDLVQLRYSVWF